MSGLFSSLCLLLRNYVQNLGNAPLVFILTFVLPFLMYMVSQGGEDLDQPPQATPHIPLLGNALHYKKNPDVFLAKQAQSLGGIFSINLAGLQTTILSSKQAMKQLAFTPERVLSSNAAVSDFGFRYTLGDRNVFKGTDVHKRAIKQQYSKPGHLEETAQLYWKFLKDALEKEVPCDVHQAVLVEDFFVTARRIILRTITYEMIGKNVVDKYDTINNTDFISDFMIFQDLVEDCTAKAAVCPTWLASVLFLKDCERRRLLIVSRLSDAMNRIFDGGDEASVGKWLQSLYNMKRSDDTDTRLYQCDDIGDFAVGLLFAGHKNPAIAAAQAVLFSLEFDNRRATDSTGSVGNGSPLMTEAYAEAKSVQQLMLGTSETNKSSSLSNNNDNAKDIHYSTLMQEGLNSCVIIEKVVVETLRVTAHSIGAVRKVMVQEGWKVSVEDERNPSCPVKHYILPYGTYVGVSHIIPHRNKLIWGGDCASFNPHREKLLEQSNNDLEFTTFSHGVHKCPGSAMAVLIVRLFVVALLSHFEVSIPDCDIHGKQHEASLPPPSFERATLAQRAGPCTLLCKRVIA